MAILGLALFGSRARRDGGSDADVDFLAVTTDRKPTFTVRRNLAVSTYPLGLMVAHAGLGDLFVLHVITEGQVIYESEPVFEKIKAAFRYNGDYAREIQLATDVGWFLTRFGDQLRSAHLLNSRMAWTTRTIAIARAAAQQRPVFGERQLADDCKSPDVAALIHNRNSGRRDPEMLAAFTRFLRAYGGKEPRAAATLEEQHAMFSADRNQAGLRLIGRMMKPVKPDPVMKSKA